MRIGIDARLYGAARTGIGSYTFNLVRALARLEGEEEYFLFSDEPLTLPDERFHNPVLPLRKRILWTLAALPFGLRSRNIDLFHGTANFEVPIAAGCSVVATVHDLIPLHFPELVSRKFYLLFRSLVGRAVRISSQVITDSEFSRRDILSRYGIPQEKVTAIPLAADSRFNPHAEEEEEGRIREKYDLPRQYVLFVGVFEPRKNVPLLVNAFLRFQGKSPEGRGFQLALAGGAGYRGEEIAAAVRSQNLEPGVRLLGYVPDEDLPALYRQAVLVVIPSQFEGFGLPALEAMGCGTPVLAADNSSLPEIVGEGGELFRTGDVDLLAAKLEELILSPERLAELGRRGRERALGYTWDKTAAKTVEVYRTVLETSGERR